MSYSPNRVNSTILHAILSHTFDTATKDGGEPIMGDKSPKSTKKQAAQKQAKAGAAQQKKKDAEASKQAAKAKK